MPIVHGNIEVLSGGWVANEAPVKPLISAFIGLSDPQIILIYGVERVRLRVRVHINNNNNTEPAT